MSISSLAICFISFIKKTETLPPPSPTTTKYYHEKFTKEKAESLNSTQITGCSSNS
jgi:hypothetical protein